MKSQVGQVIIILLLIILVALTIGVAIVQNSLTGITTSTKTGQSARAFSAAEAGVETALVTEDDLTTINTGDLGNQSSATVDIANNLPNISGQALEYPPLSKADFAHFWLQDPNGDPLKDYKKPSFRVWFGNCEISPCWNVSDPDNPPPAVEVNLIRKDVTGKYISFKKFYDPVDPVRAKDFVSANKPSVGECSQQGVTGLTTESEASKFYCYVDVKGYGSEGEEEVVDTLVLVRVRVLYANKAQKVALGPTDSGHFIPPQASLYTSEGKAGESIRVLKVLKVKDVVPPFFDFAIFSAGPITK